ncbi:MAG: MoxR family ATPase [Thermoguttaceae bacterium]|jgi:MoxR-like ATPase
MNELPADSAGATGSASADLGATGSASADLGATGSASADLGATGSASADLGATGSASADLATLSPDVSSSAPTKTLFERITAEVRKVFVGQDELVLGTLVALFSNGHVLIESVPGLGKTLFVRTLGQVLGCQFGRIQFTADLMPSDITGAPIFDMKTQEFRFRPGPVFTQLLLADEINRSPAKTHAALLEIMQEYRVTIERTSHPIARPFLVMATQNPIESEGTYNLPEAQLDRFMFKLLIDYPSVEEEANILAMHSVQVELDRRLAVLQTVTNPAEIVAVTCRNGEVQVDPKLLGYVNALVRQTRAWPQLHLGASPRAGISLMQGARTLAAFRGRDYVVPDDVVELALPALRHRVILSAEAEVEGQAVDDVLREVLRSVEVPRL